MAIGSTPEGHTPEKPTRDESGKPGPPGAGLSPEVPHAADAEAADDDDHAADAHHTGGGHDHDHEAGHEDEGGAGRHEAETLGPVDWRAWSASLLGLAIAALIGLALALPTLPR